MDKKQIEDLIAIMDDHNLSALRVSDGDEKVELERRATLAGAGVGATAIPALAERVEHLISGKDQSHEAGAAQAAAAEGTVQVKSPMVGMFYTSPSPDEDPYVKPGQEVLSGQTLGIIEAMKTMTEITASTSGVVTEVLAANGEQVEYDQPLFTIKPTGNDE